MTLEERIEQAAAEFVKAFDAPPTEERKELVRRVVENICRAFTPELFTDPPTGWIAPWAMTWEMAGPDAEMDPRADEWARRYATARDEHLSRHPMKPTEAKE